MAFVKGRIDGQEISLAPEAAKKNSSSFVNLLPCWKQAKGHAFAA